MELSLRVQQSLCEHQESRGVVGCGRGGTELLELMLIQDDRGLAIQRILWEPAFWLLGNMHPFSIDHREGFQAGAFM